MKNESKKGVRVFSVLERVGNWKIRKKKGRQKAQEDAQVKRASPIIMSKSWSEAMVACVGNVLSWFFSPKISQGLGYEMLAAPSSKPHSVAKKMSFEIQDASFDELPWGSAIFCCNLLHSLSCINFIHPNLASFCRSNGQDCLRLNHYPRSWKPHLLLMLWEVLDADYSNPGQITSFPLLHLCMHWWLGYVCNHCGSFILAIYMKIKNINLLHLLSAPNFPLNTRCHCLNLSHATMSAQLNASSSWTKSRSLSPTSSPRLGIRASVEPSVLHKGRFTFRVERNETKVSTSALATSVQTHYETFCLVGKVFEIPVNSRVIRHRLKSEWKNLQGEVSIDHIGRDWYKVKFNSEANVLFVLKNRPWFVQGQIFALQHWTPDFSPFHAVVTSIVGWVRIPFLPLHYKDPEVLYDLVSILGDPISVDLQSVEGK